MTTSKGGSSMINQRIEALRAMKGASVEAGWFDTARYKAGKDVPEKMVGVPVAKVARIQEFGASIQRGEHTIIIPARPFMRLAYKNFKEKHAAIQKKLAAKMARGDIDAKAAMKQIGLFMEGCIVDSIKNGGWQPNAPSTVAKKGFDTPLIDSAQMWQSVSSQVSKQS